MSSVPINSVLAHRTLGVSGADLSLSELVRSGSEFLIWQDTRQTASDMQRS